MRGSMALMPAALQVAPEQIATGNVWIATGVDGQIAGVVALAPGDAPGVLDLNKLFIEPRHIRSGLGRALFALVVGRFAPLFCTAPALPRPHARWGRPYFQQGF